MILDLPPGIEPHEYIAQCVDESPEALRRNYPCRRFLIDRTVSGLEELLLINEWVKTATGWRCSCCERKRTR